MNENITATGALFPLLATFMSVWQCIPWFSSVWSSSVLCTWTQRWTHIF